MPPLQHNKSLSRCLRNGSSTFMCLYDFEKAVEYPILDRLYAAGIHGRCWRLLKNWYDAE